MNWAHLTTALDLQYNTRTRNQVIGQFSVANAASCGGILKTAFCLPESVVFGNPVCDFTVNSVY